MYCYCIQYLTVMMSGRTKQRCRSDFARLLWVLHHDLPRSYSDNRSSLNEVSATNDDDIVASIRSLRPPDDVANPVLSIDDVPTARLAASLRIRSSIAARIAGICSRRFTTPKRALPTSVTRPVWMARSGSTTESSLMRTLTLRSRMFSSINTPTIWCRASKASGAARLS